MDDLVVCPSCLGMGHHKTEHYCGRYHVAPEFSIDSCRLCNGRGHVERRKAYEYADNHRPTYTWGAQGTVGGM